MPSNKSAHKGKQLKDILPKIKKCKVCALGGIFYGYVARHNNYCISDSEWSGGLQNITDNDCLMRNSIEMFTNEQLYLIEVAFESYDYAVKCESSTDYSYNTIYKAKDYRRKHGIKTDNDLLIHIMNNIISNGGTFKP